MLNPFRWSTATATGSLSMIRSRFLRSSLLVLTTAVALSCSEYSPTGPQAPAQAQDGLLGGLIGIITNLLGDVIRVVGFQSDPNGIPVTAIQWSAGHINATRSVSATIGVNGGSLAIPGSDFTITFPYGALSQPTSITIVSDNSGYVSYDMQPHGLTFAKPVVVTQRLKNTAVYGTPLALNAVCAYFATDLLDLGGILQALEIETTTIFSDPNTGQATVETWQLNHFSRYMLASD
ncbi:MAG TPA: hypothetical protein VEZ51_10375 [Gemmatimonadaceae bacterium]|nr:hypothetical protein [Gemmatimonadaceae bacterium]